MVRSFLTVLATLAIAVPAWAGEMDRDAAPPAKVTLAKPAMTAAVPATELDQESPTQTCWRWRWGGWGCGWGWRGGWGVGWGGGWGGWYRPWGGCGVGVGFYRPWGWGGGWYGGWGRPWGWGCYW